ncbi:DMP19 family protein [Winogradskyella schleiferi]|uniref:DMP19 family protein n=1 Tax=Winogradskyella schleiferi TaxID=2686078 RepID=UPI0015BED66A|nr:DUF4375 domain-containing protein [Winogradskyella schleiferi]
MNFLNLFNCKAQNENDPYWEFNENNHFRPQLNKGDFYKLSGYDFGWFVLEPLSNFVEDKEHEIEKTKSFSYGQKALYYWWYLDAQVTNGGFVQFYYNGYESYVPTIIKGMEYIGDKKMADLVKRADKIYQKNKKLVDKAQESDLFGSDIYDRLDELSFLDDEYYDINEKTMLLLENYIRKNPSEIGLDEQGKEFEVSFSGTCKTYYPDGKVNQEFNLRQDLIDGEFRSYYQNGNPKEKISYIRGEQTGVLEEYYENGNLKYQVVKEPTKQMFQHKWYYENGNPKKIESKRIDDNESFGPYKEWYENGQLAEMGTDKSNYEREGEWVEFYKNGNKKDEAEYINGKYKLRNHWNEQGIQTLKNGTGYSEFYSKPLFKTSEPELHYREYKNYEAHGVWKETKNDILRRLVNYNNGKRDGIMETYYNNGNLEKRTVYDNDKVISEKDFSKFENPKVKTVIVSELCNYCYQEKEAYVLPENVPKPTNATELANNFIAEVSMFEPYGDDYVIQYSYVVFVDKKGNVNEVKFSIADNMWISEQVESNLKKMKFEIATMDGKVVESIHYVKHKFFLVD